MDCTVCSNMAIVTHFKPSICTPLVCLDQVVIWFVDCKQFEHGEFIVIYWKRGVGRSEQEKFSVFSHCQSLSRLC